MFVWRLDVFQRAIEAHAPEIAHAVRGSKRTVRGSKRTVRGSKRTVRGSKRAVRRPKPLAAPGTAGKSVSPRLYRALDPVSIDVAVLEREDRVVVVRADFRWSDVGGWGAMADLWGVDSFGNASRGDTLLIDCAGTIAYGGDRLVALLGVDDLIVVDSPDALLVCAKGRAQEVRRVVNALTEGKRLRLL
jgi:mannose-1-phosphate guanylyltransferase